MITRVFFCDIFIRCRYKHHGRRLRCEGANDETIPRRLLLNVRSLFFSSRLILLLWERFRSILDDRGNHYLAPQIRLHDLTFIGDRYSADMLRRQTTARLQNLRQLEEMERELQEYKKALCDAKSGRRDLEERFEQEIQAVNDEIHNLEVRPFLLI